MAAALAVASGFAGFKLSDWRAQSASPPVVTLEPTVPGANVPPPAPSPALQDVAFNDLTGRPRRLAEWPDKLLVVNFWATWCPPCLTEIPGFVALQERWAERGLQFVGVALDEPDAVKAFMAEHHMNYPVLVGQDDVARFMQALGNNIGALPFTVVIAPDGRVLHRQQGQWKAADAAAVLEPLL